MAIITLKHSISADKRDNAFRCNTTTSQYTIQKCQSRGCRMHWDRANVMDNILKEGGSGLPFNIYRGRRTARHRKTTERCPGSIHRFPPEWVYLILSTYIALASSSVGFRPQTRRLDTISKGQPSGAEREEDSRIFIAMYMRILQLNLNLG